MQKNVQPWPATLVDFRVEEFNVVNSCAFVSDRTISPLSVGARTRIPTKKLVQYSGYHK